MAVEQIDIAAEADIVIARQAARQAAHRLGFGAVDQSRVATAVSELARNVVRYATEGKGRVRIRLLQNERREGLEIVVEDDGPGIEDIELAMQPGYTSARGMGLGLSGTRRLMDEMVLTSQLGSGTKVLIRKWKR